MTKANEIKSWNIWVMWVVMWSIWLLLVNLSESLWMDVELTSTTTVCYMKSISTMKGYLSFGWAKIGAVVTNLLKELKVCLHSCVQLNIYSSRWGFLYSVHYIRIRNSPFSETGYTSWHNLGVRHFWIW